jgi:hypothetical protein
LRASWRWRRFWRVARPRPAGSTANSKRWPATAGSHPAHACATHGDAAPPLERIAQPAGCALEPDERGQRLGVRGARSAKPGGFAVAFCPDRGQLLRDGRGRGWTQDCSYTDGARVTQPTDTIGIELDFSESSGFACVGVRMYHNGKEFGGCGFRLPDNEPLCWTAGVRNPGDTIRLSGLKWRSREYVAAGSEVCVPPHVTTLHHRYERRHQRDSSSLSFRSDERAGDLLVRGGSNAVWNTNLV